MGWCTTLYTSIEFNRCTYNTLAEVEKDLEHAQNMIYWSKKGLSKLAYMTEPKKFCEENESPEHYIEDTLEDYLEALEEYSVIEYKLSLLKARWDKCHNEEGLAIEPPNDDLCYLDGDFLFTDKCPTQETLLGSIIDHEGNVVDDSNCIINPDGTFKKFDPVCLNTELETTIGQE